jgi:hypothetical protein
VEWFFSLPGEEGINAAREGGFNARLLFIGFHPSSCAFSPFDQALGRLQGRRDFLGADQYFHMLQTLAISGVHGTGFRLPPE